MRTAAQRPSFYRLARRRAPRSWEITGYSTFAVLGGHAAAADQAPRTAWISVSVG